MSNTIFLIGFMGSGKTTVGKKLSAKLGLQLVDLDAAIEQREGAYIRDIIADRGEPHFRAVEAETLRQLDFSSKVISTGGGTPCFFDSMAWMKANGVVVYIEMDEAALFSRLKTTNLANRPLLMGLDDDGLKAFIHTKLAERLPIYTQADVRFNPIRESLDELITKISLM